MKKYIVIVLMFFSQMFLFAQNTDIEIHFETNTTGGNYIEVDVKANDFISIFGYQMYIQWDSTVLKYDTVTYSHNSLEGVSFHNGDFIPADILSSQWFNSDLSGLDFDDNTTLFTVKFLYLGDPCDETVLKLTDAEPNRRSLVNYTWDDEQEYPMAVVENTIQIPGTDCGQGGGDCNGFSLIIDKIVTGEGSDFCVKIKVDSFENIQALQFSVGWDTDVISWVKEQNNWAAGQGANVTKSIPGDSLYYYLMDSPSPLTLKDGDVLVELCFKVNPNAVNGDFSELKFVDSLTFEVTDSQDNSLPFCDKNSNGKVTVGDVSETVTFIASNEKADKDENVCMNITSRNFKEIESFQFITEWDPSKIDFTGIGSVNNINIVYLASGNGHIVRDGNNRLKISWNNANGVTVDDDDTLFQLCYNVVGDCDGETIYEIKGSPSVPFEVSRDNKSLPHEEINGSFKVECAISIDTIIVTDVPCNGESKGKIFIKMECGSCSYNFKWSEGSTGPSLNAVKAGTYSVTITDNSSLKTLVKEIEIKEPAVLDAAGTKESETCDSKGSISLNVTGGTAPYTYLWSNSKTTKDISNLDKGTYSVTITDNNNCPTLEKSFAIDEDFPALVVEKADFKDFVCKDGGNGEASINISGGCVGEGYGILWSDGVSGSTSRTGISTEGKFSVTVTDAKSQEKVIDFIFTNPDKELTVTGDVVNGNPAKVNIDPIGGEEPYTFNWTGPNGFASTDEDLDNLTEAGIYTVVVKDSRGCEVTSEGFDVTIEVELVVNYNLEDFNGVGVKCNGDCNGKVSATITGNVPWVVTIDGDVVSLPYSQLCAGDHTIKVVDNFGKTFEENFEISEPDVLTVEVDDVTCSNDGKDDGAIKVKVSGGAKDYTYDWGDNLGGDSPEISDLPKGKYSVTVKDENGCEVLSSDIVVDNCDKSDCYQGSLIMSPNGDEFNEFFLVRCYEDFSSNELIVYDRLGNKVYSEANYSGKWNGLNSDGNELIEDSYMWVFIGVKENGDKSVYKGTVTIIR